MVVVGVRETGGGGLGKEAGMMVVELREQKW